MNGEARKVAKEVVVMRKGKRVLNRSFIIWCLILVKFSFSIWFYFRNFFCDKWLVVIG